MSAPMSTAEIPAPPGSLSDRATVVVAVLARAGGFLEETLQAIHAQTHTPLEVFVVGGEQASGTGRLPWVADVAELVERLDPAATHVWLLHDDARPHPDALAAMVADSERVDGSVVGSKILRHGELLESVGSATDVFGQPSSGLEEDEIDQEQYDVVRDVSYISNVSMLVRRDLLRGVGGLDGKLPQDSQSIDFSQRARVAGGRVVVAPASEVEHHAACVRDVPGWREQAGRIRATLVAYRPLTLLWVIPVHWILGLIDGLVRLVLTPRLRLFDWLRAWLWNLAALPSTLQARRAAQKHRQVGDEELFRFQVSGSVVMRRLADDLSLRFDRAAGEEVPAELEALFGTRRSVWQRPSVLVSVGSALAIGFAARGLLGGDLPAGGFALPLRETATATLSSYAGGWNFGGLGSPEALHPSVGALSGLQALVLGNEQLAVALATIVALVAGAVGMTRLLGRFGLGPWARAIGGLVLLAGPVAAELMGAGYWPALMALGAIPWTVLPAFLARPTTRRAWWGRTASWLLAVALLAAFAPLALLVPVLVVFCSWLMGAGSIRPAARVLLVSVLAAVVLLPWALDAIPGVLTDGAGIAWSPPLWILVAAGVALVATVIGGDRIESALGAWGGLLVALGAVVSRLGLGRETSVAGLVMGSLGLALLVAVAVDLPRRREERTRLVALGWLACIAGLAVAASTALVMVEGRLGLPPDRLTEALEFTETLSEPHGPDRILLVGEPADIPGEARLSPSGYAYRVVSAPLPTLDEAWLAPPLPGDDELAAVLAGIEQGRILRPGAALAPFGIRWVVFTSQAILSEGFRTQLDMAPLNLAGGLVAYQNEVSSPRAATLEGRPWRFDPPRYTGAAQPEGRVVVAENADSRWGEDWSESGWRNEVGAPDGSTEFAQDPTRRALSILAGAMLVASAVIALWGGSGKARGNHPGLPDAQPDSEPIPEPVGGGR
jgi:GT2 family glycosyltransferase